MGASIALYLSWRGVTNVAELEKNSVAAGETDKVPHAAAALLN
jgi:glycine/D-amino acid oxidase-like deaminating enzyme